MFDHIIIGGGVAGLSAAQTLSSIGSTLLLEAEDALGYHASGRSAAMFLADYGNQTVRTLNHASHEGLVDAGVLSQRQMMLVAKAEEEDAFRAEFQAFGMSEVGVSEACERLPILNTKVTKFAAVREDVFDLDTDALMQLFRKEALRGNAQITTQSRVTHIERRGDHWEIGCQNETYQGRMLINVAGAWADHIADMAGLQPMGLQPYRRSMARLAAPGGLDTANWPFTDGVGEAWYAKPDAGAWLVSPSEEHPLPAQDAWADDMVLAEGLARYEDMVTEPVTKPIATWAGLRTFAPDRALVIGPDPTEPSFVWLAGQGGYGFQTAIAAADLLYDRVTEATPRIGAEAAATLAPDRFR